MYDILTGIVLDGVINQEVASLDICDYWFKMFDIAFDR